MSDSSIRRGYGISYGSVARFLHLLAGPGRSAADAGKVASIPAGAAVGSQVTSKPVLDGVP